MLKIKNSLFMKLILLLIFVIVVPSAVSNIIAYRQNYNMIKQQIIDWNSGMLEIGMEQALQYVREIEQAPLHLFSKADVIRILNKQTRFTDMERYVIRKYEQSVSERGTGIFRVTMLCQNKEVIDGIYVDDQTSRNRIAGYRYEENNGETFQVGKDEKGNPVCLIYNVDIPNVPAFDTIASMRIFSDLKAFDNMSKTLCGQYEDSVTMVCMGDNGEDLIYTSSPFQRAIYDRKLLFEEGIAKGTLDERDGIFFLKTDDYKGKKVHLAKFVDSHWFEEPAKRALYGAMVMQCCLLVVSMIFLILVFNMFISPVRRMLKDMKEVEQKAEFVYKADTRRKDELGILEKQYAGMMRSLNDLINKNYRNQLEVTKSRFKMLQAQINPHFLYNMLQYISNTARKSSCLAVSEQLTQLGELFQYTCNADEDVVELRKELHHLENYMSLQGGRFGGRLHFMIRCPEELGSIYIPKMILQPLVENSIKHGIDKRDGTGNIMVSILDRNEKYYIRVIDNGIGMTQQQIETLRKAYESYEFTANAEHGIGFLNVLQRCQIYYGDRFLWEIRSIPKVETTVEFAISKIAEKEEE